MTEFEDILGVTVDFNELDEDGLLVASLHHLLTARLPRVGERVWLEDPDGNSCWGSVVRVAERVMHLRLDLSSWQHEDVPGQLSVPAQATAPLAESGPASSPPDSGMLQPVA
jgi:hypothetical protein